MHSPGRTAAAWLCAATVIMLAGCSGLQTTPSESTAQFIPNSTLTHWQLRGKIGVKNSDSANSGYLNWLQCGERFEVRINGPLGSGAVKLVGDEHAVTFYENNRPPVSAASAEELLQQQLGWPIPVNQLSYWVRGIPAPNAFARHTELGFKQLGWNLDFPRQTQADAYRLPAKAIARQRDLTVTLILQQWQLQPDCNDLQADAAGSTP